MLAALTLVILVLIAVVVLMAVVVIGLVAALNFIMKTSSRSDRSREISKTTIPPKPHQ